MEKDTLCKYERKAEVTKLISDKVDSRVKKITRNREEYYVMT